MNKKNLTRCIIILFLLTLLQGCSDYETNYDRFCKSLSYNGATDFKPYYSSYKIECDYIVTDYRCAYESVCCQHTKWGDCRYTQKSLYCGTYNTTNKSIYNVTWRDGTYDCS